MERRSRVQAASVSVPSSQRKRRALSVTVPSDSHPSSGSSSTSNSSGKDYVYTLLVALTTLLLLGGTAYLETRFIGHRARAALLQRIQTADLYDTRPWLFEHTGSHGHRHIRSSDEMDFGGLAGTVLSRRALSSVGVSDDDVHDHLSAKRPAVPVP